MLDFFVDTKAMKQGMYVHRASLVQGTFISLVSLWPVLTKGTSLPSSVHLSAHHACTLGLYNVDTVWNEEGILIIASLFWCLNFRGKFLL